MSTSDTSAGRAEQSTPTACCVSAPTEQGAPQEPCCGSAKGAADTRSCCEPAAKAKAQAQTEAAAAGAGCC